jgi:hypothetical protein
MKMVVQFPDLSDSDFNIKLIRHRGWPFTKAAYVKAMFSPFDPLFPLDAGTVERIPQDLPGPIPICDQDLSFPPRPSWLRDGARRRGGDGEKLVRPEAERRIDPVMVADVAARHGFTLEVAEEELKKHGA